MKQNQNDEIKKPPTIRIGDLEGINILLSEGKVLMKPRGNSMVPIIHSGDEIEISLPEGGLNSPYNKGDAVYCKVKGNYYVHLIKAVKYENDKYMYQIGNNKGGINGWTSQDKIYGKVLSVNGQSL